MNKEEIEAAQRLVNSPITAENVDEPIIAVFPAPEARRADGSFVCLANCPCGCHGEQP